MSRKLYPLIFIYFIFILCLNAQNYSVLISKVDSLTNTVLKTFNVPGTAIAIVKDSSVIFSKGYGIKNINSSEAVDTKTLFGIASNTKAFTSAALSILVDEGKINWDDKVTKYIPEFEMYDNYVTNEMTIRDLLTHRSGLSSGHGDLMSWPVTDFSRKDIINRLKYLKPSYGFRTQYGYSNLLYMVAGELIPAVTGKSWEEFIKEKIFKPIGMKNSISLMKDAKNHPDFASPHIFMNNKLSVIEFDVVDNVAAAASIVSNLEDLSKWVMVQLHRGRIPGTNNRLFSQRQSAEMWKAHSILFSSADKNPNNKSNFNMYGLGWNIQDIRGYYTVSHTGGLFGMVSKITLIPELKVGIIVLTNQQEGAAFGVLSNVITDYFTNGPDKDWIKMYKERGDRAQQLAEKEMQDQWQKRDSTSRPSLSIEKYCGSYSDNWLGEVTVELRDNRLSLKIVRSPKLNGYLEHYQYNTFIVRWDHPEYLADCYVTFSLDFEGKIKSFDMLPVNPMIDFSLDFQDLLFKPIKK